MKILLLADPPMGDKVAHKLQQIPGVEIDYRRNKKLAAQMEAVQTLTPGSWVIAMNVNGAGPAFKEHARQVGATFVSIPPSWSAAQIQLGEAGLWKALHAELRGARLTHRPFAPMLDATPVLDAMVTQLAEKGRAAVEANRGLIPHQIATHGEGVAFAAKVAGLPTLPEPEKKPSGLTPEARKRGTETRVQQAKERLAYARSLFEHDPLLDPRTANAMVKEKMGQTANLVALYEIRREVCQERGLPLPKGSAADRYRTPAATPAPATSAADVATWAGTVAKKSDHRPAPPPPTPATLDALTDLRAAVALAWAEAKKAGVTFMTITGPTSLPPKVNLEREIRTFEKTEFKVDP